MPGVSVNRRFSAISRFWFFSLSLITLRVADICITALVSPDLRWEMNPLVSVAGLGWPALLLANIAGTALVIGFAFFSLPRGEMQYPPEAGYTRKEFIAHYLFGERDTFHKIYYVVPYNKRAIVEYCGYVFVRVLTVWSFVVVLYNFAVWHSEAVRAAIADFSLWISVYALLVVLVLFYSYGFFNLLYADYGRRQPESSTGP